MPDERTPSPWTFDEHGGTFYVFGPGQAMVADGNLDDDYLARIRGVGRRASVEEQRANAAFIVEACNAHDDLVEILRAAMLYTDPGWDAALLERMRAAVSSPRVYVKKTP